MWNVLGKTYYSLAIPEKSRSTNRKTEILCFNLAEIVIFLSLFFFFTVFWSTKSRVESLFWHMSLTFCCGWKIFTTWYFTSVARVHNLRSTISLCRSCYLSNLIFVFVLNLTEKTQCYATGFGVADIGRGVKGKLVYVYKDKLQVLALTVLNRLDCSVRYPLNSVSQHHICVGSKIRGKSTCKVNLKNLFQFFFLQ